MLLVLVMTLSGISASWGQKAYTPQTLPNVHLEDARRYVTDPDGILSQAARDSIDAWFYDLEMEKGIESVIAVVESIGEADCFDFCHELLNSWGVGKSSLDNGLVILLVKDQRCIQFYTGYGLEGVLPDAICKRIQTLEMVPDLKEGDWEEGMVKGCRATVKVLRDGSDDYYWDEDEVDDWGILGALMTMILGVTGVSFLTAWKRNKCPVCGKHKLKRVHSICKYRAKDFRTYQVTYICQHCGHIHVRTEHIYESRNSGGPVIGTGGFGGGFGGGGHFGGGHGGGGGAGTHF